MILASIIPDNPITKPSIVNILLIFLFEYPIDFSIPISFVFSLTIMFKIFMKTTYYLEELPLYISMKEIVLIYIVTTVIVFLSTLYPAIKASRLKPVEALKHE